MARGLSRLMAIRPPSTEHHGLYQRLCALGTARDDIGAWGYLLGILGFVLAA